MGVESLDRPSREEFAPFLAAVEPRLLQALMARYGPVDGREATVDALSWAWENWDRLSKIDNRAGYLYRVGQSATRRFSARPIPNELRVADHQRMPEVEPGLVGALEGLPEQQRTVVMLVHAFGWTQTEVAELLGVGPSTVREHLARALVRLRKELQVQDVN